MSTDRDVDFFYFRDVRLEEFASLFNKLGLRYSSNEFGLEVWVRFGKRGVFPVGVYEGHWNKSSEGVSHILLNTAVGQLRSTVRSKAFLKLCEEVYYFTKPFVATGCVLEYSENEYSAIEKFLATRNIAHLVVESRIYPGFWRFPGAGPTFYSPQALKELKANEVNISFEGCKKLKDSGFENPI